MMKSSWAIRGCECTQLLDFRSYCCSVSLFRLYFTHLPLTTLKIWAFKILKSMEVSSYQRPQNWCRYLDLKCYDKSKSFFNEILLSCCSLQKIILDCEASQILYYKNSACSICFLYWLSMKSVQVIVMICTKLQEISLEGLKLIRGTSIIGELCNV